MMTIYKQRKFTFNCFKNEKKRKISVAFLKPFSIHPSKFQSPIYKCTAIFVQSGLCFDQAANSLDNFTYNTNLLTGQVHFPNTDNPSPRFFDITFLFYYTVLHGRTSNRTKVPTIVT